MAQTLGTMHEKYSATYRQIMLAPPDFAEAQANIRRDRITLKLPLPPFFYTRAMNQVLFAATLASICWEFNDIEKHAILPVCIMHLVMRNFLNTGATFHDLFGEGLYKGLKSLSSKKPSIVDVLLLYSGFISICMAPFASYNMNITTFLFATSVLTNISVTLYDLVAHTIPLSWECVKKLYTGKLFIDDVREYEELLERLP